MKQGRYRTGLVLIIFLAAVVRFWNFSQRMVLYSDSARDAVLAQGAVIEKRLPLTGSFSSVGPFVFGPVFYWYIIAFYLVAPNFIFAPWYGLGVLSVIFCILLADAAKRLSGRSAGLVTGLLAAVSPAQANYAVSLTQHSFVGIIGAGVVWTSVVYSKTKKWIWALMLGAFVGIAISLHYQALSWFVLVGIICWVQKTNWQGLIRDGLAYFLGFLVSVFPLVYWDTKYQLANLRNLLDYIFIGQYRVFVSRRWLSFVGEFLPRSFSFIIGGFPWLIWVVSFLCLIIFIWCVIKKYRLPVLVLWFLFVLVLQILVIRYARVQLFNGYLIFLHPLIIFLLGWFIWKGVSIKLLRGMSIAVTVVIVGGSLLKVKENLAGSEVNIIPIANFTLQTLTETYPQSKFAVYDAGYFSTEFTYALNLILQSRGLLADSGIPIGVCWQGCPNNVGQAIVRVDYFNRQYEVSDLRGTSPLALVPPNWYNLSPANTLREVGFWWKTKPLHSPFSITKFVKGSLKFD